MIQIFADGAWVYDKQLGEYRLADEVLVYDSRLDDYHLTELTVTTGLNVGGTAEIVMPLGHPAYDYFIGHKTIVRIYRDGELRFRGRALYHADTFHGERTLTCEGELCFLRDSISRPYNYSDTPFHLLETLVNAHNSQVESAKRFTVGTVTVEDPNHHVILKNENAETTLDTFNRLLDYSGGYLVFTDDGYGGRAINWLATLSQKSDQVIEFGENLLDFTSTGASTTTLATGIVPYGARLEVTDADGKVTTSKERLTIASVNGGRDYILADDAVAVRGVIMTTHTWDDVDKPANLLKKAREYLDNNKVFVTSLELTALDLSYLDRRYDTFSVGDRIRVVSAPHGVNEEFELAQMTEDLLDPAQSRIVLGKDLKSLTREDVAGAFRGQLALEGVGAAYASDLNSVATQVESHVLAQVSQSYAPKDALDYYVTHDDAAIFATQDALDAEINARAGVISKSNGVVSISGGAPVKILGGKVEIDGSEIHLGKEIRFLNESGIRIANKDGSSYYVLRVDASNNCFVGNDYVNVYLRAKDAVYLHKTGAVVTSDRRHKNGIEELPEAYEQMLDKLTPVRFKYNDRGDTYHVGFVAQEVDEALTAVGLSREDFGGFVDVSGDGDNLGIAYDEFIGLLLAKIRRLEKRIDALEE